MLMCLWQVPYWNSVPAKYNGHRSILMQVYPSRQACLLRPIESICSLYRCTKCARSNSVRMTSGLSVRTFHHYNCTCWHIVEQGYHADWGKINWWPPWLGGNGRYIGYVSPRLHELIQTHRGAFKNSSHYRGEQFCPPRTNKIPPKMSVIDEELENLSTNPEQLLRCVRCPHSQIYFI